VLLEGTDGRKMSSSWGNTINLFDEPNDMFGKVMSISDDLIINYYTHATEIDLDEITDITNQLQSDTNPRDIKARLAFEITKIYHGEKSAQAAQAYFNQVISGHHLPDEVPEFKTDKTKIIDILVAAGLATSKNEARRLMTGKGVKVNEKVIDDIEFEPQNGDIIQKGKRGFVKYKKL
jgi:tyrosyl-tRNA synthetase